MSNHEDIKIEAVVKFNDGEAYVINRWPEFKYEKAGRLLYANDGIFVSCYAHNVDPWAKAFGGRKFNLQMLDGSVTECHGQYWDAGQDTLAEMFGVELTHVTIETIADLKKCFVFCGASADREKLAQLRAEYKGCVYPLREYKKIITFDDQRSKYFQRERKLERRIKSLIKEARKNKRKRTICISKN